MSRMKIRAFVILTSILLCSCVASVPYKIRQDQTIPQVPPNKSQIIFLRSSSTIAGGKIPAVLFDVSAEEENLIGAIPNRTKVVHLTDPGKHYFMVHSNEAADFLEAELIAGKTYYVLVRPFPGAVTYRFSFAPIRNNPSEEFNLQSDRFKKWLNSTSIVESTAETKAWHQDNSADVKEKRDKYWHIWSNKDEHQRLSQTVQGNDGV